MPPVDAISLERIHRSLHPLARMPTGTAWNAAEVAGILPMATPVAAAVLVGLVPRDTGLHVLLTRRTDDMRHHPGQVSFPGGRIEPDDPDPEAAALRETEEEIGVPRTRVRSLGWLDPLSTITGFTVFPLVASITPDYVVRADPREVADVFEVPLDYLMAAENLGSIRVDWRGRSRDVLEFVGDGVPGRRIWGATASILYNLRTRLEKP